MVYIICKIWTGLPKFKNPALYENAKFYAQGEAM